MSSNNNNNNNQQGVGAGASAPGQAPVAALGGAPAAIAPAPAAAVPAGAAPVPGAAANAAAVPALAAAAAAAAAAVPPLPVGLLPLFTPNNVVPGRVPHVGYRSAPPCSPAIVQKLQESYDESNDGKLVCTKLHGSGPINRRDIATEMVHRLDPGGIPVIMDRCRTHATQDFFNRVDRPKIPMPTAANPSREVAHGPWKDMGPAKRARGTAYWRSRFC
ncbi:hypothetical protein MKZ38_010625 [Zalerion maritima]|uniref:Uncharacterized protein n=1 Tax=Zalerion maritima TaxID=339359 RepID=A0AAD5WLT7_9PEZI|nr:hypothetical protein MKZ38_010625 [Zalerion maritima]